MYHIPPRTVAIAAGALHSLAIVQERPKGVTNDSQDVYYTFGWGYDDRGQLAQGDRSGNVDSGSDGGGTSQQRNPVRLLAKADTLDENNKPVSHYMTDSAGVSAANAYSIFWDLEGEVFGAGYNFT